MPLALILLAIIWLVLDIVFRYLIPPGAEPSGWGKFVLAVVLIVIVLIMWFLLPVHVGAAR